MISLKKITTEHLEMLCELEKNLFDENSFPMSKRVFRYHIKKGNVLIGLFDDETIIGYALVFVYKVSARIYSIGIDEKYQKRGLGRMLMDRIFDIAKGKRIKTVSLEVREDNSDAINVYKNFGFKVSKRLEKYYPDGMAGLRMELFLE